MPTVSVSRTIAASPEEVWAALADIEHAGRWNAAWTRIEFTSPQHEGAGTTFRAETADAGEFEFEATHWAPPEYIAFAPIRGEDEPTYAVTLESHAFLLRASGDKATRVELIAAASAHGLRGRLIGLFLWPGHQKLGLNMALDALQALFEPEEEGGERDQEPEASSAPD